MTKLMDYNGRDSLIFNFTTVIYEPIFIIHMKSLNSGKWLIINSTSGHFGIFSTNGKELLPFEFSNFEFSVHVNKIIATKIGKIDSKHYAIKGNKLLPFELKIDLLCETLKSIQT